MTLKAWSSTLLILCFSFAAWAQKGNSYLEKPLPQGWGTGTAHTISGDDNLFGSQIQPVDDKWWKALWRSDARFADSNGIRREFFGAFSHRPHGYG